MLDRVKEALFNILRDLVADARVLDLFSGTGALGLEALSRGARSCLFVEQNPDLARLLDANAAKCGLADRYLLLRDSVLALPRRRPPASYDRADLVLVDPPYEMIDDPNSRAELFGVLEDLMGPWVDESAVIALHHRPIPYAIWPTESFAEWDKRIYGRSQLTFLELAAEGEDDAC
jgi:16S rRNA (guanine966-N2)-methyltransferase